jgi:hypothetical protein
MLVLLAAVTVAASAQTIRGTVTDPDGAPVEGVAMTAINEETGFLREATTNATGAYAFGDLPVGIYLVSAEADGFKTSLQQNIVLTVSAVREVGVTLELGNITEEVTVISSSIIVETIGGEVAGLVTGEQVRELPLNGRNFVQLTQLMPGVSSPDGLNTKNKGLLSGVDLSVSGGSATANQWTVDGANNNDVGSNRTILVTPSVDAIEEFKIHRNSYGAEFGGAGGAQINLVTRSGSNQLKGTVYYFMRDDSFNETNFFLEQANQPKEALSFDDYGYTLGGALKKDKLHFFLSQEWNDEQRGTVRSGFVPTLAERSGDFSSPREGCTFGNGVPIDPLTGQPFPGNMIPEDRLNEAGLLFMNLFPAPNASIDGSCTNWVDSVDTPIDWKQINARLDWTINDSTNAMLRYTEDSWVNGAPNASDSNGLWGSDPFPAVDASWDQPGDSLVAQVTKVIGGAAVNTVTFSKSGNEINIEAGGDASLLSSLNTAIPALWPLSGKTATGELSQPLFWGGGGLPALWNIAPWQNEQDLVTFKNDYQRVFGQHEVRIGALYSENKKSEVCCGSGATEGVQLWGQFPGNGTGLNGWGGNTGNGVADFLLEDMYFGFNERSFVPAPEVNWEDIEIYIADSWKVRPNLSLDAGVRYSRLKEPYTTDNNITSFVPALFDPALGGDPCNGILQVPGTDPCGEAGFLGGAQGPSSSLVSGDDDNFAPRLGMAWDIFGNGNHVIRAGLGQFFQRERVNIQLDFGLNAPFTQNLTGIRPLDGEGAMIDPLGLTIPSRGIDPNAETPYNIQYNLTWEQRLTPDTTLELAYVGSRGKHLTRPVDINQVPVGDPNGNGIPDRLEYARCGGGDGAAGCRAQFRPYGVFGDNEILYWQSNGTSEYDSLQTQLITRYGRGSQFQASYTFSDFKADTDVGSSSAGPQAGNITDLDNPGLDWGPATLHRDHVFNASLIHNLPTLESKGGFIEGLFGDWTVATIVLYNTGTPLTVATGGALGGEGPAGTGFNDNQRPIRVPGVPCRGSGTQYLNPDAYTLAGYRLGDTSQMSSRGACEGPDFFQVDLSFYKNIPVGDRFGLQFRFEIFNVTDEVNLVGVATEYGGSVVLDAASDQATTILSSTPDPNFGQAFGARDPRQVQLGLKLTF